MLKTSSPITIYMYRVLEYPGTWYRVCQQNLTAFGSKLELVQDDAEDARTTPSPV